MEPSRRIPGASALVSALFLVACGAARAPEDAAFAPVELNAIDGTLSLEVRVRASVDDAEESASGRVNVSSTDLELTKDGSTQTVGMRFASVGVPRGATIRRAFVQFTVDETGESSTALKLRLQASDHAAAFTTASGNVSARPRTAAQVEWAPSAWSKTGVADLAQRTPDLSALVQEVVDRPGWSSGNALALVITGSGRRTAESYDGRSSAAPLLRIDYELPSPEPDSPDPEAPSDPTGPSEPDPPSDPVAGRTFVVAPNGNDTAAGTLSAPFRTVQRGVNALQPGDMLLVRGGTYFESVRVSVNGTESTPIVIRSYPNEVAVLASGEPTIRTAGNDAWELVNATLGEWRTKARCTSATPYAYVLGVPGYENERVGLVPYKDAAHFRATTDVYGGSSSKFYVGPGVFADGDGRCHIRLATTTDMEAVERRYGEVFADALPDPRRFAIALSQATNTLVVDGAHLRFQGLVFEQAKTTISLTAKAHHVTFDGITAWMGDRAVQADSSATTDIKILRSRLYGDAPQWVFWSDMKDSPYPADASRGTTVALYGGTQRWEIAHSHLRGSGQDIISTNTRETEIFVHHSRLENCGDDAFELEGTEDMGRVEIYENYIGNCLSAFSIGQASPKMTGPLRIYRNIGVLLRDPPINRAPGINTWNGGGRYGYAKLFKQSTSSDYGTNNAHYYQNTFVLLGSDGYGINIARIRYPDGSTVANNLLITVNGTVNRTYAIGANQVIDGNLYWKMNTVDSQPLAGGYATIDALSDALGIEVHGIGNTSLRGTNPRLSFFAPRFVDQAASAWAVEAESEVHTPTEFLLASDSPARGAAVPLPVGLPDTRPAGDIGALPFGADPAPLMRFPYVPEAPLE